MTDMLTRAEEAQAPSAMAPTASHKPAPKALQALMKMWYTKSVGDGLYQPIPTDKKEYRSNYEAAWKTLLVGNGPTHGWGVTTQGLALTGQLGVALTRASGQPVDVDYVGDEFMNAATSVDWLAGTDISGYDMVVLVLSMNDALRLTNPNRWASDTFRLLQKLRAERAAGVPLMIVGMQPIASVHGYANLLGSIAQKHADKLNGIMKDMAKAGGDNFMLLPAGQYEPGRPFGSPAVYAAWAADIADLGALLLPEGVPVARTESERTYSWAGTEKAMGWDGVDRAEPLRKLAAAARAEFKLPIVSISVMEEHVQLLPTASGPQATSIPRHLTYCEETAKQDDTLVIQDSSKDERFKDNAYIDIIHMPFYMGKALKDRDGEVIGTFCLMGPFPRSKDSIKAERFDAYAQKAQDALWAIEDGD